MTVLGRALAALLAIVVMASIATATAAPRNLADALVAALREDARSWLMNRLDSGSVGEPEVVGQTSDSVTLRVRYTYNNGSPGWVEGVFVSGNLSCLRFHDFANTCRAVRKYQEPPRPSEDSLFWGSESDADGQTGCLQRALGGSTSAIYKDGNRVTRDVQTADYEVFYRNTCRRTVAYKILAGPNGFLGGGTLTRVELPAGATHRWRCYNNIGENAFGMRITQLDHCRQL